MAQNQPFALHFVLESNKLNETNYADWICNLRIILRAANKEDALDNPLPEEPAADAPAAERNAYRRAVDKDREVSYLMLACMEPELQMQFENNHAAHDMIVALRVKMATGRKNPQIRGYRTRWARIRVWVCTCGHGRGYNFKSNGYLLTDFKI